MKCLALFVIYKKQQNLNCHLMQIIGGDLWVNDMNIGNTIYGAITVELNKKNCKSGRYEAYLRDKVGCSF